jgi:hypothetical protein
MSRRYPHNIDAEQCILGAMLLNEDAILTALNVLGETGDSFYADSHGHIYNAMVSLYQDGEPVDIVTLAQALTEDGTLHDAGGPVYIAELTDAVPTSANAEHYATIVRDCWERRHMISVCKRTSNDLFSDDRPLADVLTYLAGNLNGHSPVKKTNRLAPSNMIHWQRLAAEAPDSVFTDGLTIGTLGVLAAEGGTGKSFLSLQIALSVVFGTEIVAGFKPAKRGAVLCCYGEDDEHVVSKRLLAICNASGIQPGEVDDAIRSKQLVIIAGRSGTLLHFDKNGKASHTADYQTLAKTCTDEKYRLVIIDPLIAWAGLPNENDNAGMQLAAETLIALSRASAGAVLALHHANKQGTKSGDNSQTLARGASSLLCAARWVASMRGLTEKDIKHFGLKEADMATCVEVHIAKNSYSARSGQRHYYKRNEDGVLIAESMITSIADVENAIEAELIHGKYNLTVREIMKKTGDHAIRFRRNIDTRAGRSVTTEQVKEAIDGGLFMGRFDIKTTPKNGAGAPRNELIVGIADNCGEYDSPEF